MLSAKTVSAVSYPEIARCSQIEHPVNGVDRRFRPGDLKSVKQIQTEFRSYSPYILSVGSPEARTNLKNLLAAYQFDGFEGAADS